jgi:hypothetical protein
MRNDMTGFGTSTVGPHYFSPSRRVVFKSKWMVPLSGVFNPDCGTGEHLYMRLAAEVGRTEREGVTRGLGGSVVPQL